MNGPGGVGGVRPFHGVPEDAVEKVLGTLVGFLQWEASGGIGVLALEAIGDLLRLWIHLVEGNIVCYRVERGEVRHLGETIKHGRRGGVYLVHRWQAEDEFERAQETGLVVLGADDLVAFGVGADDVGGGAETADMVPAILRVILDGEDAGVLPKTAVAEGIDDLAESQVVV